MSARSFLPQHLRAVSIKDHQLALVAAMLLLPLVIVTVIWCAAFGLKPDVRTLDPLRPASSYTTCTSSASK